MSDEDIGADTPPLTLKIVEAVAELKRVDSAQLPPLGSVINPDALNELFTDSSTVRKHQQAFVCFQYCDYTVFAYDDHSIMVEHHPDHTMA
ncbi:HalOD1 output domain-containing protein [Haloarcula sp. JP-L23]|uniref:HalOD1 output domain-containing protein n=1 Tax=Haloarcula sp. JP-L23 TaxID=2716717 RepID=UPI00140F3239|nr:hypothetical protein G9465_23575 [Haloarcula sp. JP-L23]